MWSKEDRASLIQLIDQVKSVTIERPRTRQGVHRIEARDYERFAPTMSAYKRGIVIRCLLEILGFDETLPFRWHLDHKLVQAILVNEFCPGIFPASSGMRRIVSECGDESVGEELQRRFPQGFVFKKTRGYGSQPDQVMRSAETYLTDLNIELTVQSRPASVLDEDIFVQERLDIAQEYRVHTLGRCIVPTLTFRKLGRLGQITDEERSSVQSYISSALERLPDALISHSFCGWDIALQKSGSYKIIEINFSGVHPVFEPGFQTSGFFLKEQWGPLNAAQLIFFIRRQYDIDVSCVPSSTTPSALPDERSYGEMLYWTDRWTRLLEAVNTISCLWNECTIPLPYLPEDTARVMRYAGQLPFIHRRYMEYVEWIDKMTADLRRNSIPT